MRNFQRHNGLTLLEVLISAFIFVTIVAGSLSVWTAHSRGIAKARMVLVANELSEQIMEDCVAARFQNVDALHDEEPEQKAPMEIDFEVNSRELKAKFYTIVTVRDIEPGLLKEVKVRVEWTDSTNPKAGDRSSVQIVTVLHSSA